MAGSSISATMIGRKVESARLMERGGAGGRICCGGYEPEPMLSLPIVERPVAECEETLSEVGCPCQASAWGETRVTRRECEHFRAVFFGPSHGSLQCSPS